MTTLEDMIGILQGSYFKSASGKTYKEFLVPVNYCSFFSCDSRCFDLLVHVVANQIGIDGAFTP
jgi:hypothetical protein